MTQHRIEHWLMSGRMERNWKAWTYIGYWKSFHCFFKWLEKKEVIEENFMKYIEKPRLEKPLPRRLTQEQAHYVLSSVSSIKWRYTYEKIRNYTIIGMMLYTGMRKSEILHLKIEHIDFAQNTIFIASGKGKKDRIIPLCSRLRAIIQSYIREREHMKRDSPYFFLSAQKGNPLPEKTIATLFKTLRETTGLDFSPHSLRHTFATLMLE